MPPSEYAPQLRFLKESANFLLSQSPSTSSHLLAVHNRILHDDFKSLNQRQHETSCGACGSIRKPEWTKTIQVKRKKPKRSDRVTSRSSASKETTDGATVYKCLRCHRRTVRRHQREAVHPSSSSRAPAAAILQPVSTAATSTIEKYVPQGVSEPVQVSKAADNASSKKRAKARKQGGLQALLASKQRSQATSSSSLDLFDFLQQ